jgi:hypothetical protein
MTLKSGIPDSACHMGEQHCGERQDTNIAACHRGEQHRGERRYMDVSAGPLAKQEAQRRGSNGNVGAAPSLFVTSCLTLRAAHGRPVGRSTMLRVAVRKGEVHAPNATTWK